MTEGNTAYSYPEYDSDYNYNDYDYNDYDYGNDYNHDYNGNYEEEKITEPENETEIIMAEKARSNIQVSRPVASESKGGSVFNIILVSVIATSLLGSVIYTLDRRNTVYNTVTSMNKQLSLAEAENVRLQSELESKMSAKNVEDYAENVLGMKKMDSSQIKYIKIQTNDVVNIPEQEKGFTAKLKGFFDACVEYFRG
ncbi:MAG: cell division protein FtsL [Prevotella sp.]|nr:cell division protein FtsL [Alistipes senegalensis]MCM1357970.1 cell division protein FtsL [Prevotella sp.]MCM1473750.1 cell division protein FtsL [Muribaculaceae bacterium]